MRVSLVLPPLRRRVKFAFNDLRVAAFLLAASSTVLAFASVCAFAVVVKRETATTQAVRMFFIKNMRVFPGGLPGCEIRLILVNESLRVGAFYYAAKIACRGNFLVDF